MKTDRAIVITGASTGIGRASALRLERDGFTVFAGVRKKTDGDALTGDSMGRIMPLLLDVTDEKMITRAVKTVSTETGGELFGLMNNAGIGQGSAVELTPVSFVRELFEVNVIGIFAVTRAFMPLLRSAGGRIVNTGSAGGFISLPAASVYNSSKFAVEAISDALRVELRPFGIHVSVLEPGLIRSEILRKGREARDKLFAHADPAIRDLYKDVTRHNAKWLEEGPRLPAEAVAECVHHAFTAKRPKPRYVIGRDAKKLRFLGSLPSWARDYIVRKTIYG
ncbi:MAG: SDR family oxidoreductase [Spirochaetes bacterium]|nr:SDR family oxidoreductase [Spirochaetota bacterium]